MSVQPGWEADFRGRTRKSAKMIAPIGLKSKGFSAEPTNPLSRSKQKTIRAIRARQRPIQRKVEQLS
jgi:hypothetical protein